MADKLGDYIVGSAVETIETEKLISEFENVIVDNVYEKEMSMDTVAENLQQKLRERGAKIDTLEVENPYISNSIAMSNAVVWGEAKDIKSAKKKVVKVCIFTISA